MVFFISFLLVRVGTAYYSGPPTSVISQENVLRIMPTGWSGFLLFFTYGFLFSGDSVCVKTRIVARTKP